MERNNKVTSGRFIIACCPESARRIAQNKWLNLKIARPWYRLFIETTFCGECGKVITKKALERMQESYRKPRRIQRKRIKGWRMPENTIYVGRPSKWGNPYGVGVSFETLEECLNEYRDYLKYCIKDGSLDLKEIKGKNLACWCGLDEKCHADILLRLANNEC